MPTSCISELDRVKLGPNRVLLTVFLVPFFTSDKDRPHRTSFMLARNDWKLVKYQHVRKYETFPLKSPLPHLMLSPFYASFPCSQTHDFSTDHDIT